MAEQQIVIRWKGVDELSDKADDVTKSLNKMGDAAEGGTSKAGGLASSLVGLVNPASLAVGAIGGLVVGLGAAGKAAFDVASDIDQASDDISAKLGISKEAAEDFEDVMKDVFANNFGDDFDDISGAVVSMQQSLKDLTPTSKDAQQALLEGAFAIRDAFDIDVGETMEATTSLMREFGLSSEEAMDLLTAGLQQGLNSSDDFLDTINEYSTQFAEGGASAEEFFSLLESGMQGGALGTDKAADAFKEFRVRIQDGSDLTAESLEAIGLSAEKITQQMADGTLSAADAFQLVVNALGDVDDKNTQIQAGVGLLGTQFEDLGQEAATSLSLIGTTMEDMAGSTDSLNQQYESLGAVWEGVSRQLLVALAPIGDMLLDLANQAMPHVSKFLIEVLVPAIEDLTAWIGENLPKAVAELVNFWNTTLQPALQTTWKFINDPLIPILSKMGETFSGLLGPVGSVADMIGGFAGKIKGLPDKLPSWMRRKSPSEIEEVFNELVDSLPDATRAMSKVSRQIKAFTRIRMPSSRQAVSAELAKVSESITNLGNAGIDTLREFLAQGEEIFSDVQEVVEDTAETFEQSLELIVDSMDDLLTQIGVLPGAINVATSSILSLQQALSDMDLGPLAALNQELQNAIAQAQALSDALANAANIAPQPLPAVPAPPVVPPGTSFGGGVGPGVVPPPAEGPGFTPIPPGPGDDFTPIPPGNGLTSFGPITINSNAPVSTIVSDLEMLRALATSR